MISQPCDFDLPKLFVSPVSATPMSYAKALQFNNTLCNYGDCIAIVDGPLRCPMEGMDIVCMGLITMGPQKFGVIPGIVLTAGPGGQIPNPITGTNK